MSRSQQASHLTAHTTAHRARSPLALIAGAGLCTAGLIAMAATPAAARPAGPTTGHALGQVAFAQHRPDRAALQQIGQLRGSGQRAEADLISQMIDTPQADWFTSGTPHQVRQEVKATVRHAAAKGTVPVLVAYDLPYRDCAQYSAGGAADTAAYEAWIDGFAAGIGNDKAVVLLEPDSLGIIPWNVDLNGNQEWCRPTAADGTPAPEADPAHRYAQLNYAVDRLERQPNVTVYLDGTHSAWLGVGDIAHRLSLAGVAKAQGFFLNVSNYQPTPQSTEYGRWISDCLAFANDAEEGGWRLGHYDYCASQYYPADPNDFSTWYKTDDWYAANLGTAAPTTHFVIDTSRNGQGPPDLTHYADAPYDQPPSVIAGLQAGSWCNPPGAGLGLRPTTATGVPLLDAYLWVKTPGESDGSCDIAGGARAWDFAAYNPWGLGADAQQHFDPLWGETDPAAGAWFPQQALQLAELAQPALAGGTPHPAR